MANASALNRFSPLFNHSLEFKQQSILIFKCLIQTHKKFTVYCLSKILFLNMIFCLHNLSEKQSFYSAQNFIKKNFDTFLLQAHFSYSIPIRNIMYHVWFSFSFQLKKKKLQRILIKEKILQQYLLAEQCHIGNFLLYIRHIKTTFHTCFFILELFG